MKPEFMNCCMAEWRQNRSQLQLSTTHAVHVILLIHAPLAKGVCFVLMGLYQDFYSEYLYSCIYL